MSATWVKLLVILVYAGMSATGLALMKSDGRPLSFAFLFGFTLYGAAFGIWLFVILPSLPLSVAFPVSAGAIVLATLLIGWLVLSESLTPWKILGASLIVIGISVLYFMPAAGTGRS